MSPEDARVDAEVLVLHSDGVRYPAKVVSIDGEGDDKPGPEPGIKDGNIAVVAAVDAEKVKLLLEHMAVVKAHTHLTVQRTVVDGRIEIQSSIES